MEAIVPAGDEELSNALRIHDEKSMNSKRVRWKNAVDLESATERRTFLP